MKKPIEMKNISALLGNEKAVKIIMAVGVGLILLIFAMDLFSDKPQTPKTGQNDVDVYIEELEKRLQGIIAEIDGVGRIKVMVTLDNLNEDVYSERETAVVTTRTPVVRGVAVVCEGGDNIVIKTKIVETVSKVLGISTARVCVTY